MRCATANPDDDDNESDSTLDESTARVITNRQTAKLNAQGQAQTQIGVPKAQVALCKRSVPLHAMKNGPMPELFAKPDIAAVAAGQHPAPCLALIEGVHGGVVVNALPALVDARLAGGGIALCGRCGKCARCGL